MPDIKKILHPTDFSANSLYAFQSACGLARDNKATLVVLHVMMPSVSPLTQKPPPNPLEGSAASMPWPHPSDTQIRVEHRLAEGDPADETLRLANALGCDLIVMGTHGRTGLGRLLVGSVAEEVLRNAECPVLVVKAPLQATPGAGSGATASVGELVDVRPLGTALVSAHTQKLIRTPALEVVRLIVRAGQEIPGHTTDGDIVVHCLEGRVACTAFGKTHILEAGTLLHLRAREPHAIHGMEDASLLMTILSPNR